MGRWLRHCSFSLGVLLTSCIATPLPDPPTLDAPELGGLVHIEEDVGTGPPMPGLVANAGALEPGTLLWLVNLETAESPLLIEVSPDGSFANQLFTVAPGDELRVQARRDDLRSVPVDAVVGAVDAPLTPSVRPLADCLRLDPPLELDFGSVTDPTTSEITIQNDCTAEVVLEPRLRRDDGSFAIETPGPIALPAAMGTTVSVRFEATGPSEDVLFIAISGAATERRPITLLGR